MTTAHPWLKGLNLPPADAPLTPEGVIAYVAELNAKAPEEVAEFVCHRIQRFRRFEKRWLTWADFSATEWREPVDPSLVKSYQAEPAETAPPIIVESVERAVIDGFHRLNAARQRGEQGIWAYVGCDPRPEWRPQEAEVPAAARPTRPRRRR